MDKRTFIAMVFDLLLVALLIPLAGDLLYLYYAGGWYDPVRAIEIAEIGVLCLIIFLSIVRIAYIIRSLTHKSP